MFGIIRDISIAAKAPTENQIMKKLLFVSSIIAKIMAATSQIIQK